MTEWEERGKKLWRSSVWPWTFQSDRRCARGTLEDLKWVRKTWRCHHNERCLPQPSLTGGCGKIGWDHACKVVFRRRKMSCKFKSLLFRKPNARLWNAAYLSPISSYVSTAQEEKKTNCLYAVVFLVTELISLKDNIYRAHKIVCILSTETRFN